MADAVRPMMIPHLGEPVSARSPAEGWPPFDADTAEVDPRCNRRREANKPVFRAFANGLHDSDFRREPDVRDGIFLCSPALGDVRAQAGLRFSDRTVAWAA